MRAVNIFIIFIQITLILQLNISGKGLLIPKLPPVERLNTKLAATANPEQQYQLLIQLAEYGPNAAASFENVKKLLNSYDSMVKMAALRVFISGMQPYKEAVPELLKIIKRFPRHRKQEALRGAAVAALTAVCEDPEVFKKLLNNSDKKLKQTVSTALQDKPEIAKQLNSFMSWPLPEISVKNKSVIINGDFEQSKKDIPGWEFTLKEGASGTYRIDSQIYKSGKQSLLLEKNNGKGFIELRSKETVTVPAGAFWTWRGFYHAQTAPASSLLLFRLEDESGLVSSHDNVPRAGWAWQSQSFLLNSAPGEWRKRLLILRPSPKPRKFRLIVRIYGNPCKVRLDQLTFPSSLWRMHIASPIPEVPTFTIEQAAGILAKRKDARGVLTNGPNGQVQLRINDKITAPVIYFPWISEHGDYRKFSTSGIKIHNIVLPINDYYGKFKSDKLSQQGTGPVWPSAKSDNYNFEPLLSKLRDFVRKNPDDYLMLGFHISWPADYVKVNPGTAWQDKRGNDAYGNTGFMLGFKPGNKIKAPFLRWPSPYCDKPFEDAAKVIRAFIKELHKTDIPKIIVGCFVCGGHDGQFEILRRDFGPNGQSAWRKWLKSKYKNDSNLQKAWSQNNVNINQAPVPVNSYGKTKSSSDSPVFYSPRTEQADLDYSLFRQERIWYLKEYLIKAIKNEFSKPLLGAVWLMGGFRAKYTRPFIHSKNIDIAICQPAYQHRMPGMMTGACVPFESLKQHRKLMFKELDLRSWIRETYYNELGSMKIGTPENIAAFKSANRKEAGQMIASGAGGWWYYDISSNAFNHPGILKEIKRNVEVARWVDKQDAKFRPDAVVVLNHSAPTTTRLKIWRFRNEVNWFLQYQMYALKLSGVPFDTCYLEDIKNNPDLQKYRMYIFLNAYELNDSDVSFINRRLKRNNNILVWHYAPGYLNKQKHKYDIKRVASLTGINTKTSALQKNYRIYAAQGIKGLLPLQGLGDVFKACFGTEINRKSMLTQRFVIDDPKATKLAYYADDKTTAVASKKMNKWQSVYVAALAGLSGELLNKLAVEHGLYTVCKPNIAQVEMNSSFISISPMQTNQLELILPRKSTVTDAFSGKCLGAGKEKIKLDLTAGNTRWLLLK